MGIKFTIFGISWVLCALSLLSWSTDDPHSGLDPGGLIGTKAMRLTTINQTNGRVKDIAAAHNINQRGPAFAFHVENIVSLIGTRAAYNDLVAISGFEVELKGFSTGRRRTPWEAVVAAQSNAWPPDIPWIWPFSDLEKKTSDSPNSSGTAPVDYSTGT